MSDDAQAQAQTEGFPTPTEVLRRFRQASDQVTRDQAEMFKAMSPADKNELLFYMLINADVRIAGLTQRLGILYGALKHAQRPQSQRPSIIMRGQGDQPVTLS